jgi:hypothetical protein
MHPEEAPLYRIGGEASPPTVLVNAQAYPNAAGAKVDRLLPGHGDGGSNTISCQQGGSATFGTATLQRQFSHDNGATWTNDGAAISAATFVPVTLFRRYWYRWLVGGTGNITGAFLVIG